MSSSSPSLSEDLLFDIMMCLDAPSIRCMALTCRSLYDIFQSQTIKYIYELQLDSMQDCGSGRPPGELLASLRDRRKAWKELAWKNLEVVKIAGGCSAYEFVAGALSRTDGLDFSVHWLPSPTKQGHAVVHSSVGITIRDFAIDNTQDLVIFLEESETSDGIRCMNLHIRTISTNECHPSSSTRLLSFDIAQHPVFGNTVSTAEMQIADDILLLFITTGAGPRLLIWNWENALLIYDSLDQLLLQFTDGYNVLRRDAFLLTSTGSPGHIRIYNFSPSTSGPPVHVATLGLPPITPLFNMISHLVHSGPCQRHPTPGTLFTPLRDSLVNVFSLSYESPGGGRLPTFKHYFLFVPSSTFLRYVEQYILSGKVQHMQWEDWGEHESQFMGPRYPPQWLRFAHDSNPYPAFRKRRTLGRHEPTVVPPGDIFHKEVVTRLPYHVVKLCETERESTNYMIDEERIVGLKFLDDGIQLRVYCF